MTTKDGLLYSGQ